MTPRARAAVQPAAWRNRIVGSGTEDPTQLLANPLNWRTHPGPQRDALRGSLNEVGWVQQVMVNRTTGHVVDGHARIEEAISRGEDSVPVLYVELDSNEEALVLAALDPISAMAVPDMTKLAELLSGVTVQDDALVALLSGLDGKPLSLEERMGEWGGMPDFGQEAQLGYKQVVVHFLNDEDYKAFQRVIGQELTDKTRACWFPAQARDNTTDQHFDVLDDDEAAG